MKGPLIDFEGLIKNAANSKYVLISKICKILDKLDSNKPLSFQIRWQKECQYTLTDQVREKVQNSSVMSTRWLMFKIHHCGISLHNL